MNQTDQKPPEWWARLSEQEREAIREKHRSPRKEPVIFVVFGTTKTQWENWYSKGTYCHMGQDKEVVKVGTSMARRFFDERIAPFPREMTDDELWQYQQWCEQRWHFPRPMTVTQA